MYNFFFYIVFVEFILFPEILQNKKKVQASIFNYVVFYFIWNREAV